MKRRYEDERRLYIAVSRRDHLSFPHSARRNLRLINLPSGNDEPQLPLLRRLCLATCGPISRRIPLGDSSSFRENVTILPRNRRTKSTELFALSRFTSRLETGPKRREHTRGEIAQSLYLNINPLDRISRPFFSRSLYRLKN